MKCKIFIMILYTEQKVYNQRIIGPYVDFFLITDKDSGRGAIHANIVIQTRIVILDDYIMV